MLKLPCPSCGGPLEFRSKTTLFQVCSYCKSNIIRADDSLEKIGEMAELPEDLSPIQIGVTGRHKGKKFYVAGRIIYGWEDGIWNEWYLLFADGKDGWLAEAQGELMISFSLGSIHCPNQSEMILGKTLEIGGERCTLSDIKEIKYIGSEGELPFKAERNYRSTIYDFTFSNDTLNLFASMEYPDRDDSPFAYYGKYTDIRKLKLQNMRRLEGWI